VLASDTNRTPECDAPKQNDDDPIKPQVARLFIHPTHCTRARKSPARVSGATPLPAGYNQGHGANDDCIQSDCVVDSRRVWPHIDWAWKLMGVCVTLRRSSALDDVLHSPGQRGEQALNLPMRYRLRTLLIVLAVGPMVIAATWWGVLQTPLAYIRGELSARQDAIEYWDKKYPGWREQPEIIDRSDPIPPRAR
jgi:hypothetical protein